MMIRKIKDRIQRRFDNEQDVRDGCSSCGWIGESGEFSDKDECPECGHVGTLLGCLDYDLDDDVRSAAYRYDAFNDGVEWATAKNWLLVILRNLADRFLVARGGVE